MPLLMDDTMDELKTASNYKFSAAKIDSLGATEYTLASVVLDISGSVHTYRDALEQCIKTIYQSCQKSQRAENLMFRLVTFNDRVNEVHGFKLLNTLAESDYDGILSPSGSTALFDAAKSAIEATNDYASVLYDQDFQTNGIVFIVTDGMDNMSTATATSIKNTIRKTLKDEKLESLTVVLVGVNDGDSSVADYLERLKNDAEITQFVDIGEATPNKLAKLANFISQSISSTSQALGSGSASQLLTF
jgi:uncharacterized protein YegL